MALLRRHTAKRIGGGSRLYSDCVSLSPADALAGRLLPNARFIARAAEKGEQCGCSRKAYSQCSARPARLGVRHASPRLSPERLRAALARHQPRAPWPPDDHRDGHRRAHRSCRQLRGGDCLRAPYPRRSGRVVAVTVPLPAYRPVWQREYQDQGRRGLPDRSELDGHDVVYRQAAPFSRQNRPQHLSWAEPPYGLPCAGARHRAWSPE